MSLVFKNPEMTTQNQKSSAIFIYKMSEPGYNVCKKEIKIWQKRLAEFIKSQIQ